MNIEEFRYFCLSLPGAFEDLPFDENTLCFKVMGKIFAICDINEFKSINLKCEPAKAIELREEWPDTVVPGYHMNKKHWNTVSFNSDLESDLLLELIDHSYESVIRTFSKKKQKFLL